MSETTERFRPGMLAGQMRGFLDQIFWGPEALADACDAELRRARRWLSAGSNADASRVPLNVAAWVERAANAYMERRKAIPRPASIGQTPNFIVPPHVGERLRMVGWSRFTVRLLVEYPDYLTWSRQPATEPCPPEIADYLLAMADALADVLRANPPPQEWGPLPEWDTVTAPVVDLPPQPNPLEDLLGEDAWA